ncbi:GGDEF domain-containing protein [Massilia aurea]|uniref:GGDEF domain-containing protein n=1 Tax=Massilia aurea TaxID=373040 RepID=UPI00346310CD
MIDIQTFLLALGIGNVGFAILMAGYTHGAAPSAGLRLWMWARLGIGVSQLIGWARPMLGLPLVAGVEGVSWILAMSLEMAAYCVFFGFPRWGRVLLPITLLSSAIVLAAAHGGANHIQLSALVGAVVALFAMAMAWALLRRRSASLLQRIIGINDALFAAAVVIWVASVWLGKGPLDHSGAQQAAYLAGYMLMIVNGFGFLLLCKQKDDTHMAKLAATDSLTGLYNRHAFLVRADGARVVAQRQRTGLGLLMIDIDHFKQINDRWGHATGDEALVVFARTARGIVRDHETIGRLGGEEFALLLPGADLDEAVQAAERLRLAIREATIVTSGPSYRMTVSIGVVVLDPHEDLGGAMARADHALYAAKRAGRDRVEIGELVRKRA